MRFFVAVTLLLFGCTEERVAAPPAQTTTQEATQVAETQPPPQSHAEDPVSDPDDVTGAYFPIDPLPKEFAELEHLSLATIDENGNPSPLNGFLRPKERSAADYVLVRPSFEGNKLSFVTTSNRNVQYAFDGEFLVLDRFPENPPSYETVVLSGQLHRVRDGKTVASTPVRFRYEAGG